MRRPIGPARGSFSLRAPPRSPPLPRCSLGSERPATSHDVAGRLPHLRKFPYRLRLSATLPWPLLWPLPFAYGETAAGFSAGSFTATSVLFSAGTV